MKASKFSESQIVAILKSQTADKTGEQICREYGIAPATFYHWKKKYAGGTVRRGVFKFESV